MTSTYTLSNYISDAMTEPEWLPLVGRRAVFTTSENQRPVRTVEAPVPGMSSGYPIIRFANGVWARCDDTIELAD